MARGDIVDLRPRPRPAAVPALAEPLRHACGALRAPLAVTGPPSPADRRPSSWSGRVAEPTPGTRRLHIDVNPTDRRNEFCLLKRRLDPLAKEIP